MLETDVTSSRPTLERIAQARAALKSNRPIQPARSDLVDTWLRASEQALQLRDTVVHAAIPDDTAAHDGSSNAFGIEHLSQIATRIETVGATWEPAAVAAAEVRAAMTN